MSKLQRYKGKDYSLCVDFPVEIIGKDGVVRHYSFEESVNLYQRRIRVARMKSMADQVKDAEIDHCSKRIAQLRRSFYIRYGWEAFIFQEKAPESIPNEILGELSAYFRRRFGCGIYSQRANLNLLSIDEDITTIAISWERSQFLLYISLSKEGASQIKSMLYQYQQTEHTEQVLDITEHDDFSFVITTIDKNASLPSFDTSEQSQSHSFLEAIQAIHNGDLLEAMGHFILAIDENPYQRGAYWGGAILAEQLRAHGENEIILTMAQYYFPKDVGLLLRLCACKIRKKDPSAEKLLKTIEIMDPSADVNLLYFLHYLQSNTSLQANRYWKLLKRANHPNLHQTVYWLETMLRKRNIGRQFSMLLLFLSALAFFNLFALVFVPISIVIFWANEQYFQQMLTRALRGESYLQLNLIPSSDIVQQLTQSFSAESH